MSQPESPGHGLDKTRRIKTTYAKGADTVQRMAVKAEQTCESRTFTKRIGSTTYRVRIHFSRTSQETINDKIMRLVKNEAQNEKAVRQ